MDNGILLLGIVIAATLILFISNRVRLNLVAIQIPWHDLRTRHKELSRDKKYILMCKGGLRASIAASILKMNGINNVFNMAGGFTAYQKPGICTLAE